MGCRTTIPLPYHSFRVHCHCDELAPRILDYHGDLGARSTSHGALGIREGLVWSIGCIMHGGHLRKCRRQEDFGEPKPKIRTCSYHVSKKGF